LSDDPPKPVVAKSEAAPAAEKKVSQKPAAKDAGNAAATQEGKVQKQGNRSASGRSTSGPVQTGAFPTNFISQPMSLFYYHL
jgi:hypothetical protein